jgi:hypothetical protein
VANATADKLTGGMTPLLRLATFALALLAAPPVAEAQPTGKIYRIGWLYDRYPPGDDAFQRGLRDLVLLAFPYQHTVRAAP